jgi:AcrR family transcriptional regulator
MAKKSTRELILGVAATLFATAGFRRTTMEIIAAAAGRGRRTVYMYFENKAEIYNAVVDRELALIISPLKAIISSGVSPEKTVRDYARMRLEGIKSLLDRNPLLMKDFSQSHNRIERLREKLYSLELKIVAPYFKSIASPGKNHSSDPEAIAISFLNMLRGNDRMLTAGGNYQRAVELADLASDIILTGIESIRIR